MGESTEDGGRYWRGGDGAPQLFFARCVEQSLRGSSAPSHALGCRTVEWHVASLAEPRNFEDPDVWPV